MSDPRSGSEKNQFNEDAAAGVVQLRALLFSMFLGARDPLYRKIGVPLYRDVLAR